MLARLSFLFVSVMLAGSAELREAKPKPPAGGLLVVANQKEHTVLVVDPDNRRELAKISVGVNGHEVIVSKDSRFAYVPIYGNSGVGRPGTDGSTIDVIDLQERKLAATINLGNRSARTGPNSGPTVCSTSPPSLRMPSMLLILPRARSSRKFPRASRNPTCWFCHATDGAATPPTSAPAA